MASGSTTFRTNRPLQLLCAWLVIAWCITAIEPVDRMDWFLENLLVFFYSFLLIFSYRYFSFSNTSYLLFSIFMTLHLIGAHYTYAEVPFGYWLQEFFNFQRNHYDRIVHFSYGLLLAYPVQEVLLRVSQIKRSWSYFVTTNIILAFSSFFELLEMWIAQLVSPELGVAYLGTQGDSWDAQRDMFLALLGASISMLFCLYRNRYKSFAG